MGGPLKKRPPTLIAAVLKKSPGGKIHRMFYKAYEVYIVAAILFLVVRALRIHLFIHFFSFQMINIHI